MTCNDECPQLRSGSNRAHCGACHLTFSGFTSFDLHRRGGTCDAEGHGLVEKGGVWRRPVDARQKIRIRAFHAERKD